MWKSLGLNEPVLILLFTGWGVGVNTTTYTMDAYPKIVGISFVGVRIYTEPCPTISLWNTANPFIPFCADLSDPKHCERDSPLHPFSMDRSPGPEEHVYCHDGRLFCCWLYLCCHDVDRPRIS